MGVNRLRVLCVDDNRDLADSEAMLLDACGYDARACYDGPQALHEAAGFRPIVCLVDLDIPGMDGCEVAARLRGPGEGPPPALVAVTARGGPDDRRRTAAAGFDLHLVKPVDPAELVAAVAGFAASSPA
jgi:two-component system OmpR family response regulator